MITFAVGTAHAAPRRLPDPAGKLPAVIEADQISYDEQSATASAEGHAVLRYQDLTLRADRINMESEGNVIRAWADEGKHLIIRRNTADQLRGVYLEYHLTENEGMVQLPDGSSRVINGTVFVKSESLDLAPPETAHSNKWIHGKYLKHSGENDLITKWNNASYTTCPQKAKHYMLRSKKVTMVPGRYIVLHKPRVYTGSAYLFTLPFNMLVNQRPRPNAIRVMPAYDGDNGVGIEATCKPSWKGGRADLRATYWSEDIAEYKARIDQRITDWMSVYFGDNHEYDDDLDKTKSRPFWGTILEKDGWKFEAGWAERESRSVVRKPGQKAYDTTLWRRPELELTTPWVGVHIGDFSQYVRGKFTWGSYQETGTNKSAHTGFINRYGWGIDYYTDYPFQVGAWTLSPFYKGDYWNYGYENDDSDRQIISKSIYGIRASCGGLELGTAFEQKRVSGDTAFRTGWDSNDDTDTLYQRIGVKIGPSLRFSIQGIWDLTEDEHDFTSMGYILTYDNNCCTKWELTVNDDVTEDNDEDWVTLTLSINAFPDANFRFGNDTLDNPFGRPGGLTPKNVNRQETMMEKTGTEQAEKDEIHMPVFDV